MKGAEDLNLDAGDMAFQPGESVTLDAGDNEVEGGKVVKFDAEGHIEHADANDDDYVGVTQRQLPDDDRAFESDYGTERTVNVAGLGVVVQLDGTADVDAGETLVPSDEDAGSWEGSGTGMYSTDAEDAAVNHPFALEAGGADDLIIAIFR